MLNNLNQALKKIRANFKLFIKQLKAQIKANFYDLLDSLKPKQNQEFIKTENGIFKADLVYYDENAKEIRSKKYNVFLGKKL